MRIATFVLDGQRRVGQVSSDGQQLTPFELPAQQARAGALPLIEAVVAGQPLPALITASVPVASVHLEAPLPMPRRNLWCVGRNYHAHAKELQATVFKDNNADPQAWPIVFTKVPECVVGPTDTVQLPGADQVGQRHRDLRPHPAGQRLTRGDQVQMPFGHLGMPGQPRRGTGVGEQCVDLRDGSFVVVGDRPDPAEPLSKPVDLGQFGGITVAAARPAVRVEIAVECGLVGELVAVDPAAVDQDAGGPEGHLGVMREKHLTNDLLWP